MLGEFINSFYTKDTLLAQVVQLFAELPQVEAVALGGSRSGAHADAASDFDLYVCTDAPVLLEARQNIVQQLGGASWDNLGHDYFGGGDEWLDAGTGGHFDVMYFGLGWLREQVGRPLKHHQPSLGYTTAFAYTVDRARILYDPQGKFTALQELTSAPYPEALREAIVRYNQPLLRTTISSYWAQLKKAVSRDDFVSVNHRLAALLASYFDILFAVNRALQPGEKRLLRLAGELPSLPENFERDVTETLSASGDELLPALTRQLDALDMWLAGEGFDVAVLGNRSLG